MDTGQDLDALFARTSGPGRDWYSGIKDPEEKEFIDLLAARALERKELPNVGAIQKILFDRWGDQTSANPIRRYFRKHLRDNGVPIP